MNQNFTFRSFGWQAAPLCVRYAFTVFETLPIEVLIECKAVVCQLRWGMGVTAGEVEVLGAWADSDQGMDGWHEVLAELEARGTESLGAVLHSNANEIEHSFEKAFSSAALLRHHFKRPHGSPLTLSHGPAIALLRQRARLAIRRRGAFADLATAESFVLRALRRAECKLDQLRPTLPMTGGTRATRPRRTASPVIT